METNPNGTRAIEDVVREMAAGWTAAQRENERLAYELLDTRAQLDAARSVLRQIRAVN